MEARYKTITISLSDEDQTYVVESHVTDRHILEGNEEGVVCHMVDPSKAETIASLLNNYQNGGGRL
jgi:hypothetical protein